MQTFTDAADRQWTVAIDAPAIRRVRELLDIDLKDARTGKLMHRLADTATMVNVLYVLCQDQANQRGMTDKEFGRAMVGSPAAFTAAADALAAEIAAAFPVTAPALHRSREAIRLAVG
ncbi:MAG TPA: hypothetical protein VHY37_03505 [Tepidisphaeraceae bacterium]|jgi:hypothetical protein|nr:hypothetical protein [Tepidisphaeraceae bacterium]